MVCTSRASISANTGGHHANQMDARHACSGRMCRSCCASSETNDTGIRTETQERLRSGPPDISWFDLLGALGLLRLLGLKKEHGEDSYHPASVE